MDYTVEVFEKDWKLFRSKIGPWQEAHMERLTREYLEILQGDGLASDKFWELEKRINTDKKSPGVIIEMRRSILGPLIRIQLLPENKRRSNKDQHRTRCIYRSHNG